MPKLFKNTVELDGYIRGKMEDAMDEVYDHLIDKLIEFIEKDVYNNTPDPKFYVRQGTFLDKDNWIVKTSKGRGKYANRITRDIEFQPNHYLYYNDTEEAHGDPSAFIHGNKWYGAFDPEDLLKVLNDRASGYGDNPFNFPEIHRRPFWDDFQVYAYKWYPVLFKNACKRNGITLN